METSAAITTTTTSRRNRRPDRPWAGSPSSSSATLAVAPEPQTLELPNGSDDAPLTPHQIGARYERQGSKSEPEEKTELADGDEDPLPPAQIDANAKRDEDTDDSGGGRRLEEIGPSNFVDTEGLNELSPPIPFNPAAVVGDDEIKAAAAPPGTQQTEHPIRQRIRRPFTYGEESIAIPPDVEEAGVATSRQRDSFEQRSTPIIPGGNNQSLPNREERDSDIRVVAWRVLDDESETVEERVEEEPTPIIDAIPMQITWWQRYKKYIIGVNCVLLIGLAVAIGVSLGLTTSSSPPLSSEGSVEVLTVDHCFQDKAQLQAAVELYILLGCTSNSECLAAKEYGWPMNSWCVSQVTDMSNLFESKDTFNEDLSGWDVSNVTNMQNMFRYADAFNGNISSWKVSRVTNMESMFAGAANIFNSDISNWNVSSVNTMQWMFSGTLYFNRDISNWDVSSVNNMERTFYDAALFNQDLCEWGNKFPYYKAYEIFEGSGCTFQEEPQESQQGPFCASYCGFAPASTTSPTLSLGKPCFRDKDELQAAVDDYISEDCTNNSGCTVGKMYGWPIGEWCVSRVTDMSFLFQAKNEFNEDLSGWDVSSVTNLQRTFEHALQFNGDISNWDVSSVTNMEGVFINAHAFNRDISNWKISSVTDMGLMFMYAHSFDQDLCAWGDKFPYEVARGIFLTSGCTFKDNPQESQQGPFCASPCD